MNKAILPKINLYVFLCAAVFLFFLSGDNAGAYTKIKASSVQGDDVSLAPAKALDNNMSTRWSSNFTDEEWLEIDFGREKDIVGLELHWEAAFGKSFKILISKDGRQWKKVYETNSGGEGFFDDIYFGRRKARFLKIDFSERGTSWGYSLWEIVFKGLDEELYVDASSYKESKIPENALDANLNTTWQSRKDKDGAWIEIDLRKKKDLGGIVIYWGKDYAGEYELQVSNDEKNWKTIFKETAGAGGTERINVNVINKRYIRLFCLDSNSGREYEIREIELKGWKDLASKSSLETMRGLTGWEAFEWNTFVGRDGSFAPEPHPFQIGFWVYDKNEEKLYTPETMTTTWKLDKGRLPINIIEWETKGLKAETIIFARKRKKNVMVNFACMKIKNTGSGPKKFLVYVKVQPNPMLKARGDGIRTLEYDGSNVIRVNAKNGIFLKEKVNIYDGNIPEFAGYSIMNAGEKIESKNAEGSGVIVYKTTLLPEEEKSYYVFVPSGDNKDLNIKEMKDLDFEKNLELARAFWINFVPLKLTVPDKRYEDCFYSSIYYMLIMMNGTEIYPGPFAYKTFFLHDAVEMVNAFDKVGLHQLAQNALIHFKYNEGDGYLDGLGGSSFALYDHYRITKDKNYLKKVYPRILGACKVIRHKRKPNFNPDLKDTPLYGLLPPSVSQDNFTLPSHLYQDNWWTLLGLKSGIEAAKALGKKEDVKWMQEEYNSLKECTLASIKKVMQRESVSYMPAFADYWPPEERKVDADHRILGEAQMGSSHRTPLFPGQSLDIDIPKDLFARSYRHYWDVAGRFSGYDGGWYVEYEKFFWGYNIMLAHPLMYIGMEDVALKNIEWSISNLSCPGGWMEAMPTVVDEKGLRKIGEGIVGDVPHGWVAGYYVLLLRNMLVREENDSLLLLSCVPGRWLDHGKKIELKNAPTYFGTISFKVESFINDGFIKLTLDNKTPPETGYIFYSPLNKKIKQVKIDGSLSEKILKNKVLIPARAKEVIVYY